METPFVSGVEPLTGRTVVGERTIAMSKFIDTFKQRNAPPSGTDTVDTSAQNPTGSSRSQRNDQYY